MRPYFLFLLLACCAALLSVACRSTAGDHNPGWCAASFDADGERCVLTRNKCKKGFKPRIFDLGHEECDCECVQKRSDDIAGLLDLPTCSEDLPATEAVLGAVRLAKPAELASSSDA